MYDLLKTKLIKKLDTGLREASSIAVHPGGMITNVVRKLDFVNYFFPSLVTCTDN